MNRTFSSKAWDDYLNWQQTDKTILARINTLIKENQRDPFDGLGKPEPLKYSLTGYGFRRINDEHRLVYKISNEHLFIAQLRYHYAY